MTGARDAAWGRPIAPLRWWQWCGGLLVAAVAVLLWTWWGSPATWVVVAGGLALGAGVACFGIGCVLQGRLERVSPWAVAGRVLWRAVRVWWWLPI